MDVLQIVILALVQGLTEFLPISSSGHLILASEVLGWPDQGLAFDVSVHLGTLTAVVVFFRKDLLKITEGWFAQFFGRGSTIESRLGWNIIVATIPAGLAGLLFHELIETHLRSSMVIAISSIVFGLVLLAADRPTKHKKAIQDIGLLVALSIGVAQAFALIPGSSRSGVTITMALFLGLSRVDAARFSFLLSIPIITLSGLFEGLKLLGDASIDWRAVGLGFLISGGSAYICIHYFLSFISKISMLPFVVYRCILGVFLLLYFL